ncbi:DUF948 domain-containing protein [Paenibacillus daejeonensis]|uniref:DUF948 domain-containing protein n=1 Tax=Paenibacillus daejeonensis TaxID=135193 RepID=UPI00036062F6|nr:DUF948 domain-containing protein [Paenibacillus daejeonensis]
MVIEISVVVAVLAFSCLVYYVIQILNKGMSTLSETNKTLTEVRNAVHGLTKEAGQFIHTANEISTEVKGKMETIDPLLESVHDVGEVLQNVTDSVKKATTRTTQEANPQSRTVTQPQLRVKVK